MREAYTYCEDEYAPGIPRRSSAVRTKTAPPQTSAHPRRTYQTPPVVDVEDEEQEDPYYQPVPVRSNTPRTSYVPPLPQRKTQDSVRPGTSARRYQTRGTEEVAAPGVSRRRLHPLAFVGAGMLAALTLWTLGTMALNRVHVKQDDLAYGMPRTFQVDATVGHDDKLHPSHFIALNYEGHVAVIKWPGGDPTKAILYSGPTLFNADAALTPVTLEFKDLNGDGKPDMIIHLAESKIVFVNNGTKFVSPPPGMFH